VAISSSADGGVPVWARDDTFPPKPSDADFGLIDTKGVHHNATDAADLAEKVSKLRTGLDLVWTPDSDRLVVPESVPALHQVLRQRQEFSLDWL